MDWNILLALFMTDGKLFVELRKITAIQSISYGKKSLLQQNRKSPSQTIENPWYS